MAKSIETYNSESSIEYAERALKLGIKAIKAIEKGLWEGMKVVGDRFDDGEIFLPDVLLAVNAMNSAVNVLLSSSDRDVLLRGTVVIGSAQGDIHTIGKDIVASMLSAAGFRVYDLGADVQADKLVNKAKEVGAEIVACSALMLTTMLRQREIPKILGEEGLELKVMVGGGSVTRNWAEEIKAHYADSASNAVKLAMELVRSVEGDAIG